MDYANERGFMREHEPSQNNTPSASVIVSRESREEPAISAVQLPKVRRGTKTYFGTLCYKHPEHKGFRIASNGRCVACSQAAAYTNSLKLVPHPDGSGKLVTRGYADSMKLVPHPDGSGQMVTRGYAKGVQLVPHPNGSGEAVSRGYAESVKLVPDPWNPNGPLITRSRASHRAMNLTPEGRVKNINYNHAYKSKKRGNTPELDVEDQALTLQTIREIQAAGYTVDHMQAVNAGGPHAWWNLNALTGSTNSSKNDKSIEADCWLDMQAQGLPADTYEKLVIKTLLNGEQE